MKLKIFLIALCSAIFINQKAKADIPITINHWEITSGLVGGKLYIAPGSSATITIGVYFTRGTGSSPATSFILGSYNAGNNTHSTATSILSVSNSDFNDASQTFGHKTFTVTVSRANLPYNNLALFFDPFAGNTNFSSQAPSPYQLTDSNVQPATPLSFLHQRNPPSFVQYADNAPVTIISTSSSPILTADHSIYSANRSYRLILQNDGNLVLYRTSDNAGLWSSNTAGSSARYLYFQGDGNLVLTSTTDLNSGVWASYINATSNLNQAANAKFYLQNDGNMIMLISTFYTAATQPGLQVLGDTGTGSGYTSHIGHIQ